MWPSYVEVSLDTYRLIQQGHFTWNWIFLTYLEFPHYYFQNWAHFKMLLPVVLPCRGAWPDDCMRGSTRLSLSPEAWVFFKSKIFLFIFIYNISFYCSSYFFYKMINYDFFFWAYSDLIMNSLRISFQQCYFLWPAIYYMAGHNVTMRKRGSAA